MQKRKTTENEIKWRYIQHKTLKQNGSVCEISLHVLSNYSPYSGCQPSLRVLRCCRENIRVTWSLRKQTAEFAVNSQFVVMSTMLY